MLAPLSYGLGPLGMARRSRTPLLPSLVSLWEYEDAGNLGYDSHRESAHDLTNVNGVSQTAGKVGAGAGAFAAASAQHLTWGSPAPFIATGAYSLSTFVYLVSHAVSLSGLGYALEAHNGGEGNWLLAITPAGDIRFTNWRTAGDLTARHETNTGPCSATGTWYHLAATWDGSATALYLNGAQLSVGAGMTPATGWTPGFALGRAFAGAGYYLNGYLDATSYWSRALTAAEVSWMYHGGAGRSYAEIQAYSRVQVALWDLLRRAWWRRGLRPPGWAVKGHLPRIPAAVRGRRSARALAPSFA